MGKTNDDGGPAFPVVVTDDTMNEWSGMTLRDWFAGQALAGIAANGQYGPPTDSDAKLAFKIADAMLAARKGE